MTDLPDTSPNLGLPFYQTKQNEFEVQHNEALLMLDALVMLAVKDRDLSAPPGSPALGDRYLVKPVGTGAFAGNDNRIAQYDIGGWNFYQPQTGWTCYVQDEHALLAWDGDSWEPALDVLGGVTELQELSLLGVGTTADATNPLSAKLNNALWTAQTVAEGGDGNLRYKLSKESAAKTLSLLFQNNFSGRAEIGLTGDDDFHFKVSADGSSWLEAIQIARSTGVVTFPQNPSPPIPADLDVTLGELALGLADALNVAQFLGSAGNRFADSFDALTYVNTGGATNLDSGTAGLLKPSVSTATTANPGTLTTDSAGYSGSTWRQVIAAAQVSTSGSKVRVTFKASASGGGWAIAKAYIGHRTSGDAMDADSLTQLTFDGGATSGEAAAGGTKATDWVTFALDETKDLVVSFYVSDAAKDDPKIIGSGVTGWNTYYKAADEAATANVSGGTYSTASGQVTGVSLIEVQSGVSNVTVSSTTLTAAAAPSTAKLVARIKPVDSITLNTDLIFSASRDGGTTWSAFTMTDRFTSPVGSIHILESNALDISGQPSGTSMRWKAVTANGKLVELHDVYFYWS